MARKPQLKVFSVRGTGEFPVEAMHYDDAQAYAPADQAVVLATYEDEDDSVLWDGKRLRMNTVKLITTMWRAPTHGKWESFCWKVAEEARPPTEAEHYFLRQRFGHDWLTRDYPKGRR